ncbi:hypothetical protein RvY_10374 [Ramazzottius varieornatus]|uniref:DDE-1 domain-containing protein n=1 Tax=Ramazzottius varieornatus TaxID=947166 RepID=A0A1D1VHW6_RAMVA|nr:hypothetical protein RvY_10374 [Ramazzottius varieornatus]
MPSLSELTTASQVFKELSMHAALHDLKNGQSVKVAARLHGVSRATLRNRTQNPELTRVGAPTEFPSWEEDRLKCNTVGDSFFRRFLKRHPEISLRVTHSSSRKKNREWTTERCEEYISKLQDLHDRGFLDRPVQVWNLDGTAFSTSEMFDRVVARKGAKQIPFQFDRNEKENVTILPCRNASGTQLKFMALYAGKVHVQSRLDDTFGLCYHAVNLSGYMDQIHFANYIQGEVFPAVTELKNVVFVDGHFSHVNNLLLTRYCKFFEKTGKEVAIFCLPTGQTNHLQPFHVSVFGGIKKRWRKYLPARRLTSKDNLLSHVVKLWYHTEGFPEKFHFNAGQSLKSGFAKFGLYPFSPDVIRKIVKAYHDPNLISSEIQNAPVQDFGPLLQLLREQYGINEEKDLVEVKQFILLKQRGISLDAVLACTVQKDIFGEPPKKLRRVKNRQLSLAAGALTTHPGFIDELEKEEAENTAKKAATASKRKASSRPVKEKIKKARKKLELDERRGSGPKQRREGRADAEEEASLRRNRIEDLFSPTQIRGCVDMQDPLTKVAWEVGFASKENIDSTLRDQQWKVRIRMIVPGVLTISSSQLT